MFEDDTDLELEQQDVATEVEAVEAGADGQSTTVDPEAQEPAQSGADERPQTDEQWKEWREKTEVTAQAIAQKEMAKNDAEIARRFGEHNHPLTGQPITSMNDYLSALDAQRQITEAEQLKSAGVDPAMLNQYVTNHPVLRQAEQLIEQSKRDQGDKMLNEQVSEIGRIDPAIKTFNDLTKMPTFGEFDRLARSGYDLVSAFKLANYEELTQKGVAAAKQAAINQTNSKSHLNKTFGAAQGEGGEDIPADAITMFKSLFPEDSPEKLRERYNKAR